MPSPHATTISSTMTSTGVHTLPQTDDVLAKLNQDVQVVAFFSGGSQLERQAGAARRVPAPHRHLQMRFVDPFSSLPRPASTRSVWMHHGLHRWRQAADTTTVGEAPTPAPSSSSPSSRRACLLPAGPQRAPPRHHHAAATASCSRPCRTTATTSRRSLSSPKRPSQGRRRRHRRWATTKLLPEEDKASRLPERGWAVCCSSPPAGNRAAHRHRVALEHLRRRRHRGGSDPEQSRAMSVPAACSPIRHRSHRAPAGHFFPLSRR